MLNSRDVKLTLKRLFPATNSHLARQQQEDVVVLAVDVVEMAVLAVDVEELVVPLLLLVSHQRLPFSLEIYHSTLLMTILLIFSKNSAFNLPM